MAPFVKTSPVNVVQVNSEQLSVQKDEHQSEHQSEHESLQKTNTEVLKEISNNNNLLIIKKNCRSRPIYFSYKY